MMHSSQYEAILEVDATTEELAQTMEDTSSPETPQEHALPPVNFNRARRWSLDVISPMKLFSKRDTAPVTTPDSFSLTPPPMFPVRDRRHSSPNVKLKGFKFKQPRRLFSHHLTHQQRLKREAFLMLNLDSVGTTVITCNDDEHAISLLLNAMMDHRVSSYRMIVTSTKGATKLDVGLARRAKSCENLLEATDDNETDGELDTLDDVRHRFVSELLDTETQFFDNMQFLYSSYAEPLRKASTISKGDYEILFAAIEPIMSLSESLIQKLKALLDTWDSESVHTGNLFSKALWIVYKEFCCNFSEAKRLLQYKYQTDFAFKEFCEHTKKQGIPSLQALLILPVTRISDYGKYLTELLQKTDPSHADYDELTQAVTNVNSIIKEKGDELSEQEKGSDMEVAQERHHHDESGLFNTDDNNSSTTDIINNNSEDKDKTPNKPKGLSLRRMSAPSALLFKSLAGNKSKQSPSLWPNSSMGKKDLDLISQFKMSDGEATRTFVMEGAVQFATCLQIQERYLFLFNDLLLVTKQKSNTTFKLKHRVHVCDIWLASCLDEVAETTRPADRSFVIGWPTVNYVATFPRPDLKEHWLKRLKEHVDVEKLKDKDKIIQLKVAPRDIESTSSSICHVTVNNQTEAKDVLLDCLTQLNIQEHEAKEYQLWVLSGKEGSPYPLIGHETPFSIKLSHIRGLSRSRSGDDVDNMTAADLDLMVNTTSSAGQKCEFYLKQKKSNRKNQLEDTTYSKSAKKNKKSPNIFHTLFRKRKTAQHLVFGLPLSEVCDENLDPPESILKLMVLVYRQGPSTPGILRRGNKASLSKEIREKIDAGDVYTLEDYMAPTAASVFKEFLRSIPDGLLVNDLYEQWNSVKKDDPHGEKINKIKTILANLPATHYRMIKLTISLLQHLAKHSHQNQMGPSNLATCIAPSFYTNGTELSPHGPKGEAVKQVQMQNSVIEIQNVIVPLLTFMIINHVDIFGEDILIMYTKYGCEASPAVSLHEDRPQIQMQPSFEEDELVVEEDDEVGFSGQHTRRHHLLPHQHQEHMQRDSNSGTDSDSMHSVLSMQETDIGLQHNDSSTDSLVDREYYSHEAESSPKAVKSHISPSNLSRDSGLTLSDTQLYDEEACQGDTVSVPVKLYQRSSSHFLDRENMEAYTKTSSYKSSGGQFDRVINPMAPPRKRQSRKGRDSNEESDIEQPGFSTYFDQRAPFKHSLSTTQIDNTTSGESGSLLTHPLLNKRVSSDSIGEEDEVATDKFHPVDFERMIATTDIGTVVKSESGAHLYLNEENVPTKYSLSLSGNKAQHRFVRQSSVTDSTPPISPQSRYSQSSHDSAYSVSRDESIHSAPNTPDEPQEKSLNWVPDINMPGKPWDRKLLHLPYSLPYSKSTSDLLSESVLESNNDDRNISDHEPKIKPISPKLWPGKFHEAEEIGMSNTSHFTYPRSGHYSTDNSPTTPDNTYRKQWLRFDKGSPPPKVILQTIQNLPKKDSTPVRASYNSSNTSHAGFSGLESCDPSMKSVRHEEYLNVRSKPIIITPPGGSWSSSVSTASRRARLSKYMSSSMDLPLSSTNRDNLMSETKRPEKPPNYQQAVERNLLIKHNKSLDSAQTKIVDEPAQANSEQRNSKFYVQGSLSHSSKDQTSRTSLSETCSVEGSFSSYASKDNEQSTTHLVNSDKNKTSGYIDPGSILLDPQKNVVGGFSTQSESFVESSNRTTASRSLGSTTLGRSGSNGSSASVANIHKPSESHKHHSDPRDSASIPASTLASRDGILKTCYTPFTHRAGTDKSYHNSASTRNVHPMKPDIGNKIIEDSESDDMVMNEKDPQTLYQQSVLIYEQTNLPGVPSSNFQVNSVESPESSRLGSHHHHHAAGNLYGSPRKTFTLPSQETSSSNRLSFDSMRSRLEAQSSNLYRNRSVSVEQLHELSAYSPLSSKGRPELVMQRPALTTQSSYNNEIKSQLKNIKSELHQNFLRARSCFNQSEDSQHLSPPNSSHPQTQQSSSHENKLNKWSSQPATLTTSTEDMTVESALLANFRTKVPSKSLNNPSSVSGTEAKKEFHWSVKDLKSIYDKSKDTDSNKTNKDNKETTLQSFQQHPHSPPPYQYPPPVRSTLDSSNVSTSSTSTRDSNQVSSSGKTKTLNSHKLGPQSYLYDNYGSFSSSEDGYSSSLDRKSVRSGSSSQDSEALSDYTNITYV